MRADRLLSLLMTLQTRGRMTAEALAAELEVSVRTIYRDLTALSVSGVPVYAKRGPGGGVALVEEYRTTLTGLTPDEARALFMLNVPAPLMQLGVGQELKTALLKLSAALPDSRRTDESRARQLIHLDSSWWFQPDEAVSCLPLIRQALWQDQRLLVRIRKEFFNTEFEQQVDPYGLVAKANLWHFVYGYGGAAHVIQLAEIIEARLLDEACSRPANFDLAAFWEAWCADYESRPAYMVKMRVSPTLLPMLKFHLDERLRHEPFTPSQPDSEGWLMLELPFESLPSARAQLLGMGRAVEVLEPEPLRKSLVDFARQITDFYHQQEENR